MKTLQVTPSYNQFKFNSSFTAGKIRIKNSECFALEELKAIVKNDEFKKLANIAGTKGRDLYIKASFNSLTNEKCIILKFNDTTYTISDTHSPNSLASFTVKRMMSELEDERIKNLTSERGKALKFVDKPNATQDAVNNSKKSIWQKFKDLF